MSKWCDKINLKKEDLKMFYDLREQYYYADSHDETLKILAYFRGRIIIKDSVDRLYYYYRDVPKEDVPQVCAGMLNDTMIISIEKLSKQEQQAIREYLKEQGIELLE